MQGFCDDRFEAVGTAFAANFEQGGEIGASVAVTIDGEFVVDLWDGLENEGGDRWRQDTIVNVYSTTKTMTALCLHLLADRGELDFARSVGEYWPDFKANGKQDITVAQVMSHSSGVSGWDEALTPDDLYDWEKVTGLLAVQAPWWEPGTACGYHALTQGYLQGEILGKITGQSVGDFFSEHISGPLEADFHIGLDTKHDSRVATLKPPVNGLEGAGLEKSSLAFRTLSNPRVNATEPQTREWRAAQIPAASGFGNARSVSRVHSVLACGGEVDGVRIHSDAVLNRILDKQLSGLDQVLGTEQSYGMGYGLSSESMPLPNNRAFYWGGWGGSLAIVDTEHRMTISYVMNRMYPELEGDLRGAALALAAYSCVLG